MSGGSYNYAFAKIECFVEEFRRILTTPERKAFATHLVKVAAAMRAVEWNDSGDGADEESAIMECITKSDVLREAINDARKIITNLQSLIADTEKEGNP